MIKMIILCSTCCLLALYVEQRLNSIAKMHHFEQNNLSKITKMIIKDNFMLFYVRARDMMCSKITQEMFAWRQF